MSAIAANRGRTTAALSILGAALALRFIIEWIWLLPSPVADSAYFVTASVNYCRNGFLGTTAFSIDPSGQSRMVWHGFVSPMLLGALNFECRSSTFYVLLWGEKAITASAIVFLAYRRGWSLLAMSGLAA